MTNKEVKVECLGDKVHGLMVTRMYCDRIRNVLLPVCINNEEGGGKSTTSASTHTNNDTIAGIHGDDDFHTSTSSSWITCSQSTLETSKHGEASMSVDPNERCKEDQQQQQHSFLIPTKFEKGGRKQRTGYNLLMMKKTKISPVALLPIARQNISWVKVLTHRVFIDDDVKEKISDTDAGADLEKHTDIDIDLQDKVLHVLSQEVYHRLEAIIEKNMEVEERISSDIPIRIDVFPKAISEDTCRSLQQYAETIQPSNSLVDEDSFSGPLFLTKSQSKASYFISIVEVVSKKEYMFGVATREEYFNMNSKMNDHAANEVIVQAADGVGKDVGGAISDSYVPLSRAYYKLKQVFEDHASFISTCVETGGSGVDLGSSPGGWVQNLHKVGIQKILSIDPGILAERAANLRGVKHWMKDYSSEESIREMASFAPFSICVCDASTDASEVLTKVGSTLVKVNEHLQENECNRKLLYFPAALVITIKCPFKSTGSLGRMLLRVSKQIPTFIRSILASIDSAGDERIIAKCTMLHLMANSESERTVMIRFEKSN